MRANSAASTGNGLPHLSELLHEAPSYLKKEQLSEFTSMLFELESNNLDRIQDDIDWFVEKFKYENKDKDWKESKDAIPRAMQKLSSVLLDNGS